MSSSLLKKVWISKMSISAIYYAVLVSLLFLPDLRPILHISDGQQLGEATLTAIDIAERTKGFYKLLFVLISSSFLFHVILNIRILQLSPVLKKFSETFAIIGIVQAIAAVFNLDLLPYAYLPLAIQLAPFVFKQISDSLSYHQISLCLAITLIVWLQIIWLWPFVIPIYTNLIIVFSLFVLTNFSYVYFKINESNLTLAAKKFAFASFLPLIVIELQYLLLNKGGLSISPYLITIVFLLLIFFWAFKTYKNQKTFTKDNQLFIWISIACGLSLHTYYKPYGIAPPELFELANRAIPLMEWHYFQTLPLLEKASSHLVSDYGFGIVYNLIHGYHELDFLIYDVFDSLAWVILGMILFYHLGKDEFIAFYLVCFFPFFDAILPPYYAWALLPLIFLMKSLKRDSKSNSIYFAISIALLIPWRADLSFAMLISSGAVYLISVLTKHLHWKFIIPTFISTSTLAISLLIIAELKNIDWFLNLKTTIQYLLSEQSYGLSDLGNTRSPQFIFQHFILPAIVALLTASILIKLFKSKTKSDIYITLLYLSFFYLINLPRGIVRHGFAEGFDNFLLSFAPLIILSSIFLFANIRTGKKQILFIAVTFTFCLFLRQPERAPENSMINKAFVTELKANTIPLKLSDRRLTIDSVQLSETISLAKYLRSQLSNHETFLDFGNTPMLYFYAEKPVPSFFYQSPQNVHSIKLQEDWLERLSSFDVHLVLMKHAETSWWDATDGVPNEIRHYLISDFLFKNYFPQKEEHGYDIWKKKTKEDTLLPKFIEDYLYNYYDLKKLPSIMNVQLENPIKQEPTNLVKVISEKHSWLKMNISGDFQLNTKGKIVLKKENNSFGGYEFNISPELNQTYIIKLSHSYSWWCINPDYISIELPDNTKLNAIEFAQGLKEK